MRYVLRLFGQVYEVPDPTFTQLVHDVDVLRHNWYDVAPVDAVHVNVGRRETSVAVFTGVDLLKVPGVVTIGAEATLRVRVVEAVRPPEVAVRTTLKVPDTVGVPLMVDPLTVSPEGSPVADHV